MGKTRGRLQTLEGGDYGNSQNKVLCFLMHGDAAIAGQGNSFCMLYNSSYILFK